MQATAHARYIRISPRKVNIVNKLIRGKSVNDAKAILRVTNKAAAPVVLKLLNSAAANAENNHSMDVDSLYVSAAFANQGPTLKRIMIRARGSADRLLKRTSHVTITVAERE